MVKKVGVQTHFYPLCGPAVQIPSRTGPVNFLYPYKNLNLLVSQKTKQAAKSDPQGVLEIKLKKKSRDLKNMPERKY